MPLKEEEKKTISRVAKEFGAKRIWVFGSALKENKYNDIDLAVEGIPDESFFKFYGRLGMALKKNIDLFDIAEDIPFLKTVRRTGKVIYAKQSAKKGDNRRTAAHN